MAGYNSLLISYPPWIKYLNNIFQQIQQTTEKFEEHITTLAAMKCCQKKIFFWFFGCKQYSRVISKRAL